MLVRLLKCKRIVFFVLKVAASIVAFIVHVMIVVSASGMVTHCENVKHHSHPSPFRVRATWLRAGESRGSRANYRSRAIEAWFEFWACAL